MRGPTDDEIKASIESARTAPRVVRKGIYRYRSHADANADTEHWERAALKAREAASDASRPDLDPGDAAALAVWRLGLRARDLRDAGDPDAAQAEAEYRDAHDAAVEAGYLMRCVDAADLRARHPVLHPDAEITVGVGWKPLLETALARLSTLAVTATLAREKFGVLDLKVYPSPSWTEGLMEAVREIKAEAVDASAVTCEACGAPGSLRRRGRAVTRCDAHEAL